MQQVVWPFDQGWRRPVTGVPLCRPGGSGINSASLRVNINDAGGSAELLNFDSIQQALRIDLLKLNLPALKPAQTMRAELNLPMLKPDQTMRAELRALSKTPPAIPFPDQRTPLHTSRASVGRRKKNGPGATDRVQVRDADDKPAGAEGSATTK